MIRHAASLLVLACLALPAAAQDVTPSQTGPAQQKAAPAAPATSSAIGTDVLLVRVAGPWETADQKGFSRMIAKATGGKLALSVEWVADDGAIVQADHEEYRDLSPSKLGGATTVVDGRRVVQPHASLTVITLGSRQMNGASEGHGRAE